MPLLDWLNKSHALRAAAGVPFRLLEAVSSHGDVGGQNNDNWLIRGDNLEALKALLPFFAGRVKCIYIDPPYNTRSAFEHYDDNLEHSQWLSLIYPRLELLRELLAEDGSIWVSIDDNEAHYLKVVMDEVFGRGNFVTSFIWQKVDSPNDNKVPITPDHEFLLCYEKQKDKAGFRKKSDASLLDAYSQRDEMGRLYRDRLLKKNGKNSLREDRPTMFYPLTAPDGTVVYPIHDDGREANWAYGKSGVDQMVADSRLVWKQREKAGKMVWVPYTREYAPSCPERPHPTILLDVKTTRQAKSHQRDLLPHAQQFDTVKPEQLVQRVFEVATNPGDLVLDSFLGSGTTAAVAHKMGRRWIGIEMGEHARTHCLPRLEKVVAGEQGGISAAVNWSGGGGFRFFRLGQPVFLADGGINPEIRFATLAAWVWYQETRTPLLPPVGNEPTPLLGVHEGTACYLLYNGILGDRRPQGGNVLTGPLLASLDALVPHTGPRVVYGESSRLSPARLKALGITFRQIPYDIRAR
ncbi:MAG: site-specific DNA-methyltransferase [Dechloromonas sp.]|uniref:site-specific DNA-methyltransferase (adenine-specific) n=1 Tax=Candidatus Dechloromonas phosphorivorans TaxID=2899244 RepID=A0A9D7QHR5_9RHOO|nr:site-specific DNA-methyltransferase [Candidatus Dechloromonas phosphorivorans]